MRRINLVLMLQVSYPKEAQMSNLLPVSINNPMPRKPDLNTMPQTRTLKTRLRMQKMAILSWADPAKKAARIASMLANRGVPKRSPHTEATKEKLRQAHLKRWEGVERAWTRGKKEKPSHPMLILKGGVWVSNKKEEMSSQD